MCLADAQTDRTDGVSGNATLSGVGEKDCGVGAGMDGGGGEQSQLFQGRHRERERSG